MIGSIRNSLSNIFMQILLSVLALSFVVFYGFSAGPGSTIGVEAIVDGEKITSKQVGQRYRNLMAYYQRLGLIQGDLSPAIMQNLQGQALQGIIQEKLLAKQAKQLGWKTPVKEVRENIKRQFSDDENPFDVKLYKRIIKNRMGMTPAAFEKQQASGILAQKFQNIFTQTSILSEAELRANYKAKNEMANLDYVRLSKAWIDNKNNVPAPSQEELAQQYEARKEQYRIPEKKNLRIAMLALESLIPKASEMDIADLWQSKFAGKDEDAKKARFHAKHILLRTNEDDHAQVLGKATRLHQEILNGASFEDLARKESEDASGRDGGDLGYFIKGAMVPAFENQVFSMSPGEVSRPIKSQFGYHIIKFVDQIPAGENNKERLQKELSYTYKKDFLSNPSKRKDLQEQAAKTLDAIDFSASSSEQNTVSINGASFGDELTGIGNIKDSSIVLSSISSVKEGQASNSIATPNSGYSYRAMVDKIIPSRLPALDEISSKLQADVWEENRKAARKTYVDNLLATWQQSETADIQSLARQEGLQAKSTGPFKRDAAQGIPSIGQDPELLQAAFAQAPNSFYAKPSYKGDDIFLAQVKNKTKADWSIFDKEKDSLLTSATGELDSNRAQMWLQEQRERSDVRTGEQLRESILQKIKRTFGMGKKA